MSMKIARPFNYALPIVINKVIALLSSLVFVP